MACENHPLLLRCADQALERATYWVSVQVSSPKVWPGLKGTS